MARKYPHIKVMEAEILRMKVEGKTHREIVEAYGLTKKQVKKFIERHNKACRLSEAGIVPSRRGRPLKENENPEQAKDNEIKRLKMENELLRDFLRHAGRR